VWYYVIFRIRFLPILLSLSRRPTCVPYSPWNLALYKIFKLKSASNLYHVPYFMGTLSVNYALDLRKLNFLQKLSAHHSSVMNLLFSLTASKEFELTVV